MADDALNTSPVPAAYLTPQQLQAAYIQTLMGHKNEPQQPIRSWTQVASGILNTAADQMQLRRLMQGAQGVQQGNAALAFPGAGGGGGSMLGAPPPSGSPTVAAPSAPSADTSAGPPELTGQAPASSPDDLLGFIKTQEGYKSTAYPDGKQYSIGWGTKAKSPDEKIDPAEASRRLTNEVDQAAGFVDRTAPNAPPGVKRALTDLTYNTGTKWADAGLGQAVKAGDYGTAQKLFLQYNHANGQVMPGLTERRQAAAKWFGQGGPPASTGGQALAFSGEPAQGGPIQTSAPAATAGAPAAAPPGNAAFAPQQGTFINPSDLPGRPQRNWAEIQRRWPTMSPQDQAMYRKEFEDTNGGRNPMTFTLPSGAGQVQYHPDNPSQQTFYPKINVEKSKDVSGNDREFEYVLDPKTGSRIYRGGVSPPTAEQSIQGAAQLAGAKKGAEEQAGGRSKYYDSLYRGFTGSAIVAAQQKQNLHDLESIAQSPDFKSGAFSESKLAMDRMAATLGINTKGAAPREVFNMLAARVLADQFSGIKSMASETGEQGARIFKPMLDIEEKANVTSDDTPAGILAKLHTLDQAGNKMLEYGKDTIDYRQKYGQLDENFEKQMLDKISNAPGNVREGDIRQPEGKSAPAATETTTRTIGGKTYYQRNGKWFTE